MRRHRSFKRLAGLASVLLAMTLVSPAEATVAVQLSRAELVQHADLVVRATIGSQASAWNPGHTQIVTVTQIRVTAYLKGSGPDTLALRQLGGTVDQLRMQIAGDARFTPGQDVVLFLRQGDGVVFLTAMAQSAYYVLPGSNGGSNSGFMVHRDLHDLAFARLQQNGMTVQEAPDEPAETLDHLTHDITVMAPAGGGAR